MFAPAPLLPSEIEYIIKNTSYYENLEMCGTFTTVDDFEDIEESDYSFCRCPEPRARRIVCNELYYMINMSHYIILAILYSLYIKIANSKI